MNKKDPNNRKKTNDELVLSALKDYLKSDKTMEAACKDAGITYAVLQRYIQEHPEYQEQINTRKAFRNKIIIERPVNEKKIELKKDNISAIYGLKLSDEEIFNAVKEYYETGEALDKIGKKYGISGVTLSKYIKLSTEYSKAIENNARFTPHRTITLSQNTIDAIQKDHSNGMSLKECAKKYELGIHDIYNCTSGHRANKSYNQIPKDLIPLIVSDYEKGGISLQGLVKKYNLSINPSNLIRYIKKAGVSKMPHDNGKKSQETIQAIVNDYFYTTMTIAQIAEKYGVSTRTVSSYGDKAKEKDPSLKRMPKSELVSGEKIKSILEEFRTTDITMANLCANHSVSRNSIMKYITENNIDYEALKIENSSHRKAFVHNYDNHTTSEEVISSIVNDYFNTDLSIKEIAKNNDVSTTTVNKYVNKAKDSFNHL